MKPFDIVKELYGENTEDVIMYCMKYGIVHSDNRCFFCGYWTSSALIDTKSKKHLDTADTLFVYMAAGDIKIAIEAYTFMEPKKYIAFERFDGNVRLYDFNRFRRKINGERG